MGTCEGIGKDVREIEGFGNLKEFKKDAGKRCPSWDAGIAPQKMRRGGLIVLLLAERADSEGKKGEPPDHPSCSLSPHDETVVAQCEQ